MSSLIGEDKTQSYNSDLPVLTRTANTNLVLQFIQLWGWDYINYSQENVAYALEQKHVIFFSSKRGNYERTFVKGRAS